MNPVLAAITTQTTNYMPVVMAAVQAAEATGAAGGTKTEMVVNAVLGTSGALADNKNPNVAAIAGLASLAVMIFHMAGIFTHKTK